MGQTLTNGIYLPDEGERNCYAGLAANWNILDGAVGTVTDHTTALSGKAPLVHTHTKSDITDFPAYGNAAGTICEGNDSRLSDARTPVSHTHTKSDVTDLLNSDFIPSANNSYNLGSSSYKWKTLNGINPGALSLPDYNNVLDVTSEIPIASLDGNTQININDYLPNKTGWLSIVVDDTAGNSIIATQGRPGGSTAYNNSRTFHTGTQSNGLISVFFPILADMNKFVSIKASSLIQMRFYYCLGNV